MTLQETDLAINMVKDKRRNENAEAYASRSVDLPCLVKGIFSSDAISPTIQATSTSVTDAINVSIPISSKPIHVDVDPLQSNSGVPQCYKLLPVSDSVLKNDGSPRNSTEFSNTLTSIPSTVTSYAEDLKIIEKVKVGEEYHEYSVPSYSPNDEIDEGYRTNSSVSSGSPSACSVASYECVSPRGDISGYQIRADEKVRSID